MNDTVRKGGKPKGSPKSGGGSRKGILNKTSANLKNMILGALDESGGVGYLVERANDPRTASAFMALVGRVLPMTVQGTGVDGEHVITVIERRIVKAK
jgi:hypothetical protein